MSWIHTTGMAVLGAGGEESQAALQCSQRQLAVFTTAVLVPPVIERPTDCMRGWSCGWPRSTSMQRIRLDRFVSSTGWTCQNVQMAQARPHAGIGRGTSSCCAGRRHNLRFPTPGAPASCPCAAAQPCPHLPFICKSWLGGLCSAELFKTLTIEWQPASRTAEGLTLLQTTFV
jgi:hypothetical protein